MMVITIRQLHFEMGGGEVLSDQAYKPLQGDSTPKVEWHSTHLIQRSTLDEDVKTVVQPWSSTSTRQYGLHKIQKERVPIRS
jgi:hypothetical protein